MSNFHSLQVVSGADECRHDLFQLGVAAMALFVNILVHPMTKQATSDLEWLGVAVLVASRMVQNGCFSQNETSHAKRMGDFIEELARLAERAIVVAAVTNADGDDHIR